MKQAIILFTAILIFSATGCSTTEPRKFSDGPKIREAQREADRKADRKAKICYRSNHHLWWQIPTYGVVGLYAVGGFMVLATGGGGGGALAGLVSGVGLSFWKWEVPCENSGEDLET